jgi:hypothetical protein
MKWEGHASRNHRYDWGGISCCLLHGNVIALDTPSYPMCIFYVFVLLCVAFSRAVCCSNSSSDVQHRIVGWIMNDELETGVEWSGHYPSDDTILAFIWKEWGKPRNTSIRIIGAPTEIQTRNLLNTNLKIYRLDQLADGQLYRFVTTLYCTSWIFSTLLSFMRKRPML